MDTEDDEYLPPFERNSLKTRIQAISAIKSTWRIVEVFWKSWSEKYLLNLRESYVLKQGRTTNRTPKVGELVFLIEEDLPRNSWLLGRIESLIVGKDEKIRSVTLRLPSGNVVSRPVSKLAPLEWSLDEPEPRAQAPSPANPAEEVNFEGGQVSTRSA
ncbi:hypothetical protein L596_019604 [Steinernema carpocapsae]|uniref:DUF5641 domain-containing protein n=1 Tax=Steinernema carpocapsae TaxID=34508 RepID=A0A4U5MR31_STECR|nr:hypothetical protein L596_019604 [Steinernema carpocapsae]